MPGKPQVWYLDLFAGKNDYAAMERAGKDGHKEINRTNLTTAQVEEKLKLEVVQKQLELLKMRNGFDVFCQEAVITADAKGARLNLQWETKEELAVLAADFASFSYRIAITDRNSGEIKYDTAQQ